MASLRTRVFLGVERDVDECSDGGAVAGIAWWDVSLQWARPVIKV